MEESLPPISSSGKKRVSSGLWWAPYIPPELPSLKIPDKEPNTNKVSPRLAAKSIEQTLDWRSRAACLGEDPEIFFCEEDPTALEEAKKICRPCEVREECLDYALTIGEEFGVWGGLSETEKRKLRK